MTNKTQTELQKAARRFRKKVEKIAPDIGLAIGMAHAGIVGVENLEGLISAARHVDCDENCDACPAKRTTAFAVDYMDYEFSGPIISIALALADQLYEFASGLGVAPGMSAKTPASIIGAALTGALENDADPAKAKKVLGAIADAMKAVAEDRTPSEWDLAAKVRVYKE